MARRIFIVSLVALVALAASAFASGQPEPPVAAAAGQNLVLTGTITLQNQFLPTLKSGDKVYELLVPPFLVSQSGLKDGAKVTVEGYQASYLPPRIAVPEGSQALFVTKATVDGKEYDLSQYRGGATTGWGYGPRRGPAGGYGAGPGWWR